MKKFPNIRAFIRTSCKDPLISQYGGRGIRELRQRIVAVICDELPHVRDRFPISYFNVKAELGRSARESSVLNTDAYTQECITEGITDPQEQSNLLILLDRIGVVVKYDDTTLLDPNWLTTAVYRVLTHPGLTGTAGGFGVKDLADLLANFDPKIYPHSRHPFIIRMMEKFGLSFRIDALDERYLIPNRLPVERPLLPGWDDETRRAFRYSYPDTPPRGLLPRFIVAANRYLTNTRIAWLTGVLLSIEECDVLVEADIHTRKVVISVHGPSRNTQDALAIVRSIFSYVHDLNRFIPGQDVIAEVPVCIQGQPDAAFDYDTLKTYEKKKVDVIIYKGSDILYSVSELLRRVGPEPSRYKNEDVSINTVINNIFNDNRGGFQTGVAVGDHAKANAEHILTNLKQSLSPCHTDIEEFARICERVELQLNDNIKDADRH